MIFVNRDANLQREFTLPMTMFFIFGPLYLLYQLMVIPFFKYLLLEFFTFGCYRMISPFCIGRILQKGMTGDWEMIAPSSFIDYLLPGFMVSFIVLIMLMDIIRILFY
ncbi:hypothetical protein [Acanthopleuribacter pedis]|uniref:Uncharacterized protein n=1 Tax=Acanthopleuribacter pedis TaxID=442870 RepID=A0A8J7QSP4_9BACT|nr:hypothetical protein [Acanthopleuribacter pedis]MBO1323455.1 hypothetical protein [Acanthopleuribacter pedis]